MLKPATARDGLTETLQTYIREVLGSNFNHDTAILDEVIGFFN
jgi:hypothetical protein